MTHDLVIEGKTFIGQEFIDCCIGIDDGKITAIKKIATGHRRITCPHQLILPAAVDCHVHFRDPGFLQKETITTGSTAALFGGVSCVFDMPNTKPVVDSVEILREKQERIQRASLIDMGMYAAVTEKNIGDLPSIARFCHGFKVFLSETTNAISLPLPFFQQAFEQIKKTMRPICIHAEDSTCLQRYKKPVHSLVEYAMIRPVECELNAVQSIMKSIQNSTHPIHFCHISSKDALLALADHPSHVSIGVTPHHALLNVSLATASLQPQSYYKMNPPLRTQLHQEAVLAHIISGSIDMIESDHAPHALDEKKGDFQDVPAGVPGVETMFPLFLSLAIQKKLSFSRLISLLCKNPASFLRIPKGAIQVGFDADVVMIDPKQQVKISAEMLHSKAGWTPFEGWSAVFPSQMFLRGHCVLDDREIQVSPGIGQIVST